MKKDEKQTLKKSPKVILGLLFVAVFLLGWLLGKQDSVFNNFGFTPRLIGKGSNAQDVDFSSFWKAWDLLEKNFDGQLDYQKMVEGAIRGMTESLGDPYTSFLSKDEAKELENDLSGSISGIGAEVGIKNNKLIIISPLDDSPAKKAGIIAGDEIVYIGDEATTNMSVSEAVSKIRGEAGTIVKLKIKRNNEIKDFEITREQFNVKSVKAEIKNNDIGYINISRFDENTASDLRDVLKGYKEKNIKKIILDLRDNPGGYLDQSIEVTSEFLEKGVVVSEGKDSAFTKKHDFKATGNGLATSDDIKLVILINQGSASASEIVAGALKDHNRAILIGEKSYGKGSVQQLENLPGGAKMRITIAHWYTPKGKNIGKEGIAPDIEVKLTEDDYNNNRDPQLERALQQLK